MDSLNLVEDTVIQDWLITGDGSSKNVDIVPVTDLSNHTYRLYRFLTDLEEILHNIDDDYSRLEAIRPLVRRLLISSEWLQYEFINPNPETGWSVVTLYDEPNYPLTVQTVAWYPGKVSPIHNHATWGIVALLGGQEKNTLWKQVDNNGLIEKVGEVILNPGEIISFTADAIHHVEALGNEPTISFNLYGETDYEQRFEFDLENQTKNNF